MQKKWYKIIILIIFLTTLLVDTCFAVNQSLLNSHPSYRYIGTETVKETMRDYYIDLDGRWITSPEKETKAIQASFIEAKGNSSEILGKMPFTVIYKNGIPIKAKSAKDSNFAAINPSENSQKILQELYRRTSSHATAQPMALQKTSTTYGTKPQESSHDKMMKSFVNWGLGLIIISIVIFMIKLLKKGAKKVKTETVSIKNQLANNVVPSIKDRVNSNKYWHDLEALLGTMNPEMQRMTIYIEMPRVCKSWFIGKEKISNYNDAVQNCHRCARYLDQYSIESNEKARYDADTLELYAEALALVGIAYFRLKLCEDARYYCARALEFLSSHMPNYKERVDLCQDIVQQCDREQDNH